METLSNVNLVGIGKKLVKKITNCYKKSSAGQYAVYYLLRSNFMIKQTLKEQVFKSIQLYLVSKLLYL